MPFRNGKIAGVLNDSSTNEMSYVDMHDLHPENEQAAIVHGAESGAVSGATFASIPAALVSLGIDTAKDTNGAEHHHINFKNWKIGAVIIALGAVVMGAVRAYTAKQDAVTHNKWSDRVLSRMEEREAAEAKQHAAAVTTQREQATQSTPQVGK